MRAIPKSDWKSQVSYKYQIKFNVECWNSKSVYGGTKVYSLEDPKENSKVRERNNVTWPDVY